MVKTKQGHGYLTSNEHSLVKEDDSDDDSFLSAESDIEVERFSTSGRVQYNSKNLIWLLILSRLRQNHNR